MFSREACIAASSGDHEARWCRRQQLDLQAPLLPSVVIHDLPHCHQSVGDLISGRLAITETSLLGWQTRVDHRLYSSEE